MRASSLAAILGVSIAIAAACGPKPPNMPDWERRQMKANDITALWAQIREMRREADLPLDPRREDVAQWIGSTVKAAAKVCPDGHEVKDSCSDVCRLAEHICDNAEAICDIAKDLGPDDDWAQEKCASAKASCRDAKKKCCAKCSEPEKPKAASTW